MITQTTLLPCPFCGHPAIMQIGNNGSGDDDGGVTSDYYIECANEDCGVSTPVIYGGEDSANQLTEIWNARKL